MKGPVFIVDYDPSWPDLFDAEWERLMDAVGRIVRRIEHVGSTAVPGLGAKPIVDMMAGVADAAAAELCLAPLAAVGYDDVTPQPKGDDAWYYCLGKHPVPNHGFHLHLVEYPSAFWDRHLLFRDYLRRRADVARAYEDLKRELAARFGVDRLGYCEAKTAFVEAAVAKARDEKEAR